MYYNVSRLQKIFSLGGEPSFNKEDLWQLNSRLNPASKTPLKKNKQKTTWSPTQIPSLGEYLGFMGSPPHPLVFCTFITKGGVLKSSLTLNLARMAALHNLNTCVVGLDMQGDITSGLGHQPHISDHCSLNEALAQFSEVQGLADYHAGKVSLEDILIGTDLPTLSLIPETPELIALEQVLHTRNRREYWLRDEVILPLKERFQLIFIDSSPNWNQLITNALVSCDILISPLECKINNFRNFKMFATFISDFKRELQLDFQQIYVPSRLSRNRKLSREIRSWYQAQLPNCTSTAIRDHVQGEEAMAMHLSLPEYAGGTPAGLEMKALVNEIWKLSTQPPLSPSPIPSPSLEARI